MTLKIGDKVRFLNDVGGGVITAFIDEKTVEVQTDDGFEIPVLANELLPDLASGFGFDENASTINRSQSNNSVIKEEENVVTLKTEDFRFQSFKGEVILAIVPENDTLLHVSDLYLYLINDSNYTVQYLVSQSEGGVDEFVKQGTLESDTKLQLKKYTQTNLAKIKKLRLQGLFYKEGLLEHQSSIDKKIDVEGISFYKAGSFSENEYFNKKALVFKEEKLDLREAVQKLSENELIKVTLSKENTETKVPKPKQAISGIDEVDLHIEQIIDNYEQMSNGEIVEVQMGRFETSLETAIRGDSKRIVFIHGVGNGILKHELRKKLERSYPDLKYQDASFKEYGYGATMVYLK